MNSQGKILFTYPSSVDYQKKTIYVVDNTDFPGVIGDYPNVFYVDYFGNKTAKFNRDDDKISEGLVASVKRDQNGSPINHPYKWGYKNLKGIYTIQPIYDAASSFSDGSAVVGKIDEFNQMIYGYIDKTGKTIIPFMYSKKPGNFSSGLAAVVPKNPEQDFAFGFINKKNEIVIKIPMNSGLQLTQKNGYGDLNGFVNGYYFSGNYVLDSMGKIFELKELLKKFPLNPDNYYINTYLVQDGFLFIKPTKGDYGLNGLIDLKMHTYIPAIFSALSEFDSVSNLAYAKLFLYKDKSNNRDIYREGFINRQGIFVIVKGSETTF